MSNPPLGPEPILAEECYAGLAEINKTIDAISDPWHRTMALNWRDHYWAEVIGDLDAIMKTLAKDPVYHVYGGIVFHASTTEEAYQAYSGLINEGYRPAGAVRNARFAFADWGLVVEFTHRIVYPGKLLSGPDIDPDAAYLLTVEFMESHPYDRKDGLMGGENVFTSAPLEIKRIER